MSGNGRWPEIYEDCRFGGHPGLRWLERVDDMTCANCRYFERVGGEEVLIKIGEEACAFGLCGKRLFERQGKYAEGVRIAAPGTEHCPEWNYEDPAFRVSLGYLKGEGLLQQVAAHRLEYKAYARRRRMERESLAREEKARERERAQVREKARRAEARRLWQDWLGRKGNTASWPVPLATRYLEETLAISA